MSEPNDETDPGFDDPAEAAPKKGWRDLLTIHPAADLFPMMSEDELKALGEDIEANGMREPVTLWSPGAFHDENNPVVLFLLDGRNRLDAAERAGLPVTIRNLRGRHYTVDLGDGVETGAEGFYDVARHVFEADVADPYACVDPYAFVMSTNVHRRHLTTEQKRDVIGKLLKLKPDWSNRRIAEEVKAHHSTISAVRSGMEATGELSQLAKTVGRDGKERTTTPMRPDRPTPSTDRQMSASTLAVAAALPRSTKSEREQQIIKALHYAAEVCPEVRPDRLFIDLPEKDKAKLNRSIHVVQQWLKLVMEEPPPPKGSYEAASRGS